MLINLKVVNHHAMYSLPIGVTVRIEATTLWSVGRIWWNRPDVYGFRCWEDLNRRKKLADHRQHAGEVSLK